MRSPDLSAPDMAVLLRAVPARRLPILLFDDECSVCRAIAGWVSRSAHEPGGAPTLVLRGIGEDPEALLALQPPVEIWAAYATVHVVMPDATLKRGGAAVAEVLRCLPGCRWFAGIFGVRILGVQPAQRMLDLAYLILADLRPVLGCESCGSVSRWVRPLMWVRRQSTRLLGYPPAPAKPPHLTVPAAVGRFPGP